MATEDRWIHGSAVDHKTKDLRFLSVSQVDKGDSCLRSWWYQYPGKIKPPPSPWQERGTRGHSDVERYEKTGDRAVGPSVARGLFMVPPPGPDLLVEWDILLRPGVIYPTPLTSAHSPQLLLDAPLRFAGVPILGKIDVTHGRGLNYGAEDVTSTRDPEGTIEVCDWKFVGSDKFILTPDELTSSTQLAGYAEWVWQVRPQTPQVRLSLGYFPDKGRPRKVTRLVRREEIVPQLEHAAGVARSIARAARETDPENVDADTSACDKYGGCFFRDRCTAPMRKSLADRVGQTGAASLVAAAMGIKAPPPPTQERLIPVASLLQRAGVQGGVQVAPPPVTPGPSTNPTPAPDPAAVAAEREKIAHEEREARIKAMIPPGFAAACDEVRKFNRGFPKLRGRAAVAYLAMGGQEVAPEAALCHGSGSIDYVDLEDPAEMAQLIAELAAESAAAGGQVVNALPPDAPASTSPTQTTTAAATTTAQVMTAASAPAGASPTPGIPPIPQAPDPMKVEAPPRKRTPKAKPAEQAETQATAPAPAAEPDGAIHLYVNCATSRPTSSLMKWAQDVADTVAREASVVDVRCEPDEGALSHGKWRGVIFALVRDPKAVPLPGGHYTIETAYSDVMAVIASALEVRARESGGTVTRGIR